MRLSITVTKPMCHSMWYDFFYLVQSGVRLYILYLWNFFSQLKVLPDYLKTYNAQAVECSLYDSDSFTNDEDFIQNMEEKDFIIKVMSVQNNV